MLLLYLLISKLSYYRIIAPSSLETPKSYLVSTTTLATRPTTVATTTVTCLSLTQHPLNEVTNTHATSTVLYDTRNTLTQYPLGDTELNTVVERPEEEEQQISKQDENSSVSDLLSSGDARGDFTNKQHRVGNKTSSIENEYGLKETTIETFDSPPKNTRSTDDIFYTPAKGVTLGVHDDLLSNQQHEEENSGKISSFSSKDDGGSMKEIDLKTDRSSVSEASLKSNAGGGGGESSNYQQDEDVAKEPEDQTSDDNERKVEGATGAGGNDVMAKYMEILMQKKLNDSMNAAAEDKYFVDEPKDSKVL